MFVGTEPNGDNPNSGILDMGDWFRTAKSKGYYSNKLFYTRCKLILDGICGIPAQENFNCFRFMDLKATPGGSTSREKDVCEYIRSNGSEVLKYFISEDEGFGLMPHIIVLLGSKVYNPFSLLKEDVENKNPNLQWIQMPHPSAMVNNDLLSAACDEIRKHLVPISQRAYRWFTKKNRIMGGMIS
jgi:hypothetical protein